MLTKGGARVKVYDPFFSTKEIKQMGFHVEESLKRTIGGADCVLVATGHEKFKNLEMNDISRLVRKPACIIDGWRLFNAGEAKANNLVYYGVGLG